MIAKQKIVNMKICCMLLLLISMVNSSDHRFKQRSLLLRQFQDLLDDAEQESNLNRRVFGDDDEERYLILRATAGSNETNTGVEVTLQNHAVMNTRLRVIYTDANGKPAMVETGRLWAGQTKSVKLPLGAQNINVIVEKDLFFESWRLAYKGTLTDEKQCIRITGVTLFSKIHSCK